MCDDISSIYVVENTTTVGPCKSQSVVQKLSFYTYICVEHLNLVVL